MPQHFLEKALQGAIKSKNTTLFKQLLQLFLEQLSTDSNDKPSFSSVDKNGENLLQNSIRYKALEMTDELLKVCRDNDEVIYNFNNMEQSILHTLASNYCHLLINSVVCVAKSVGILMRKDHEGNTPLHYAATESEHNQASSLNALLTSLQKHDNFSAEEFIRLLNQVNKLGETALSLAMKAKNFTNIALLINYNINLKTKDNSGVGFTELFFQFLPLEQSKLIQQLTSGKQQELALLYENYVRKVNYSNIDAFKIVSAEIKEVILPKNTLRLTTQELKLLNAEFSLFNKDRKNIFKLIKEVDNYIRIISTNPQRTYRDNILTGVSFILILAAYSFLQDYLTKKAQDTPIYLGTSYNSYSPHNPDYDSNWLAAIFVGLTVGTGTAFLLVILLVATFAQKDLPSSQWKYLTDDLKEKIIKNLDNVQLIKHLPIIKNRLDNLNTQIEKLDNPDRIIPTKTLAVDEVITIFTQIKNILELIQQDFSLQQKQSSWSFFKPLEVIKKQSLIDSAKNSDDTVISMEGEITTSLS